MASRRKSRSGSLALRYAILIAWALFCIAPIIWFLTIGLRPRTEIVLPRPLYVPTLTLDAWNIHSADEGRCNVLDEDKWQRVVSVAPDFADVF